MFYKLCKKLIFDEKTYGVIWKETDLRFIFAVH